MSQKSLIPLTLVSVFAITPGLHAVDRTWVPNSVGSWSDPLLWEGGIRPSAAGIDSAHLITGGTATLSGNQGQIQTLSVGNLDGVTQGALVIDSTGYLRVGASFQTSTIRADSTVTVSGTLTALAGSIFNVGSSAGGGNLIIHSGGLFEHEGSDGTSTQLRLGVGGGSANVTVDGGTFKVSSVLTLGRSNGSNTTLTVKNGGVFDGSTTQINFGAINAGTQYTDVTATLNIGGETTAEAAGSFSGISRMSGFGVTNTNILNFNHTSSRYEFVDTDNNNGIELRAAIEVHLRSGVTVFSNASSNYNRGTTIHSGAVLLANHRAFDEFSSTGNGTVTVEEGGTLGGLGWINGATVVSGTLKPGDYDYERPTPLYNILRFRDDLTLTSTATLEIALGDDSERGVSYTGIALAGDGNLILDGTLVLRLTDTFSLTLGETADYQLFSIGTGSISGDFDLYTLPETWGGFDLVWDMSDLAITGWASVTAVPEPSALLLLAGAAPAAWVLRRRRRTSL